jgi:hypothetical protein
VGVLREPAKLTWVPTIPHILTYARKYVIIILANGMIDIVGDALQLFMFTSIRDLDEDMWDNMGSGIAHLSSLVLILTRGCPLNILCGLRYGRMHRLMLLR